MTHKNMYQIDISDEDVEFLVFRHMHNTFIDFMTPTDDPGILDLSVEQMDTILSGAYNYSKWALGPAEREEITKLWLLWKKKKSILEED